MWLFFLLILDFKKVQIENNRIHHKRRNASSD
jgi:hypothetical protein